MSKENINEGHIPELSPFNYFGKEYIFTPDELTHLFENLSEKYDVDVQEIYLGRSNIPPDVPTCLVYIVWYPSCTYEVYFRKNLKPDGRWVCLTWMHRIPVPKDSEKAGTYDYRKNCAYVSRENISPK